MLGQSRVSLICLSLGSMSWLLGHAKKCSWHQGYKAQWVGSPPPSLLLLKFMPHFRPLHVIKFLSFKADCTRQKMSNNNNNKNQGCLKEGQRLSQRPASVMITRAQNPGSSFVEEPRQPISQLHASDQALLCRREKDQPEERLFIMNRGEQLGWIYHRCLERMPVLVFQALLPKH